MPRMLALKPWFNKDHEGWVSAGDQFDATDRRMRDLMRVGLAIPAASETTKILVNADPPADGGPPPRKGAPAPVPVPVPEPEPPRAGSKKNSKAKRSGK